MILCGLFLCKERKEGRKMKKNIHESSHLNESRALDSVLSVTIKESLFKHKQEPIEYGLNALYHSFYKAKKEHNSQIISQTLSMLDRHIKTHKVMRPSIKKKLYAVKEYFLLEEIKQNNATITKLIQHSNPYLLDCGDIADWDNVVSCLEKQYRRAKRYNGISKLYKHLESESMVKLAEDNKKIEVITSANVYRTAIIIYLLKLYPNNLAISLSIVYDKEKSVSECFNTMALQGKSWARHASNDFNLRHYDEEYMHIWEVDYEGNSFYIPFSLIKESNVDKYAKENYPIKTVKLTGLTKKEQTEFPLEKVCKTLNITKWLSPQNTYSNDTSGT